jgi:hypothetical protein
MPEGTKTLRVMAFLLIVPAAVLLYYIKLFGVNVIFWDEWEIVPLIQKAMSGTLSFSDLFAQHNEHRILFPRIAILAIGGLTRYNTVALMFFSWILICLTGSIIFCVYRKKFSLSSYPKILIFLPVSFLLFNFRQYESILWGFTCQIYLMLFGVVATFSLLEMSKKIDFWFVLCFLSAILASFSFSVGLLVWPVGLLQILISGKKKDLWKSLLWSSVGLIVFVSYLYGYAKPSHHPPLNYVLVNPVEAGRYFLTLIGAPFSYESATATAFGMVIVLIAALVIFQGRSRELLRTNGVWLSSILFAALSSVVTTIGRSGFGVKQALSSRYTPIITLGIIGLYLLAASISRKFPARSKSFGAHGLLVLILVGLITSYGAGWRVGQNTKNYREMGAYVLMTYKIQSDENIRNYLYPNPAVVRERGRFLEQNKLNVFNKPLINISDLMPLESDTLYLIDTINGKVISQQTMIIVNSSKEETITIQGWAVDKTVNDTASAVFLTIDERINIPTYYGLDRPDVAKAYEEPNFRFSGFMATFSSSILEKGEHTISIKIVAKNGKGYYQPEQTIRFTVK